MKYLLIITTAAIISGLFPSQAQPQPEPIEVFVQEWHVSWDNVDNIGIKQRLTLNDIEELIE